MEALHTDTQPTLHAKLCQVARRLLDPACHPYLAFLANFLASLALVTGIFVTLRTTLRFLMWFDYKFPVATNPGHLGSYLPIDLVKVIVTILDAVSILFLLLVSLVSVLRLGTTLWKSLTSPP